MSTFSVKGSLFHQKVHKQKEPVASYPDESLVAGLYTTVCMASLNTLMQELTYSLPIFINPPPPPEVTSYSVEVK